MNLQIHELASMRGELDVVKADYTRMAKELENKNAY